MRSTERIRRGVRMAAGIGLGWLLAAGAGMAQSAKVDARSLRITADPAKNSLVAGFRLVDAVDVTSVSAMADGVAEPLPATWEAWDGAKAPACAWLVVVDTSNPARAKTIEACKDAVRGFLTGLPKTDAVAIFGLARDLEQVVPFGTHVEDALPALSKLKAYGDAAQTTLIYQNLGDGLGRLMAREEPRKALLLLTDGKDETPGGAAAQEIEKTKLIEAAKKAGAAVHCLGYAESLDDQKYFGALKEIASATDGLFFPATVGGKELPKGAQTLLRGVMRGAGAAHVDVSKLNSPTAISVKAVAAASVKGDGPIEVVVRVPAEEVAKALPPTAPPADGKANAPEDAAKDAADKAEAEAKAKAEAEAEAEEEKAAADKETENARKAAEAKKRMWIYIGAVVLLAILLAAILMVRASRKRAEEEQARIAAEAARAAEEARIAEETRRAASVETKKAESKPLAWLEMCDAQQTRHTIHIPNLKIGRGQHNDFVLRNDSVSGNHCVLNCNREGQWSVTDLNSGNGVVLNGERVQQAWLRHGDTIELGDLKMRFLLKA